MRIVSEWMSPVGRVSVLSWQGRFLVKIERGPMEQLYKLDPTEFRSEADVRARITPESEFFESVAQAFESMACAIDRLG